MMKLEVNFAFPGHGPAFSGVKQIIENSLRHHEQRKSVVLKSLRENLKSVYQVANEISWKTDIKPVNFQSLNVLTSAWQLQKLWPILNFYAAKVQYN